MGMTFVPLQASCYATIASADTGRASSIFATVRQVAISVGVATLATILTGYTTLTGPPADLASALRGYHVAFMAAVAFAAAGALAAFLLIKDEDAANTMNAP